ncbi:MAG: DNA primase, partial [Oscillospiraceae bacterium]|nr:DNA primase [Oscillospiraceae bacterium]
MASIFEAVKATVPVRAAAERYGLEVNCAGMVRCLFHEERTPSMKLYEDHYFCFGCGKHGDVINLVAELFSIPPYYAACKLAGDFGVDTSAEIVHQPAREELRIFREDQLRCQRVLCAYLRMLTEWKTQYAPIDPNAEPDDRYVEACQMIDTIDYLTDLLIVGTLEQRVKAVDLLLADGKIDQLEERLRLL